MKAVTVMLVTMLCWWFYNGDRFKMAVTESICWRLFSFCCWFFQCIKSVTNVLNWSPTHFVSNIDVTVKARHGLMPEGSLDGQDWGSNGPNRSEIFNFFVLHRSGISHFIPVPGSSPGTNWIDWFPVDFWHRSEFFSFELSLKRSHFSNSYSKNSFLG